jgi:L-threonylcarbamoyladenylate synthase
MFVMRAENIEILKNGGVGVIPTDTIYGLVGSALKPETVKRISELKKRADGKAFIVLISSITDLKIFGIELSDKARELLNKYWPGKVSVELFSDLPKYKYLRNPDNTNAFRLPAKEDLINLLKEVGPLVVPSANISFEPPAKNITEAKKYFGDKVDFYEDGGELDSAPSTLIRIVNDKVEVLRQGAVIISQ